MERVDTPQLLFFQFPTFLPLPRQADPFAETETETDTNEDVNEKSMGGNRKRRIVSIHGCGPKELPGGRMGKIHVYKSGKVKMTLGDVPFDVSGGTNCMWGALSAYILGGEFSMRAFGWPFRYDTDAIRYLQACFSPSDAER
ncbi:hypothetical protein BS78_04G144800 [Paspalum vaginatum]|nr:hypothetical protein BS78_04G144800 [Paspalum vaginatum]